MAALQRSDIDVMLNLSIPLVPTVGGDANLRVYAELSSLTHGLLLNARESPQLKDRRVRQPLNMAVDRQAILKSWLWHPFLSGRCLSLGDYVKVRPIRRRHPALGSA